MDLLINQYFDLLNDKKRCYCHKDQTIKIKEEDVKLFHQNEDNPKVQFLLAYYYYETNKYKATDYATNAILNGVGYGYNILGLIAPDNISQINYFLKAKEHNHPRAYPNLGIVYYQLKDNDNASKYFKMGIENGIICSKYYDTSHFYKNDANYLDLLLECAKQGCRGALDELYYKTIDDKKKREILKIGTGKGYSEYIYRLINYYETKNRFKFMKLLRELSNSNDPNILYSIGKKYFDIHLIDEATKVFYKAMDLGNYESFTYLTSHGIQSCNDTQAKIIVKLLINKKKGNVDELNLVALLLQLNENDKALEFSNKIVNPYYKNLAKYRYHCNKCEYSIAHDYILDALKMDDEQKETALYHEIGCSYLRLNNENKAKEMLELGVAAGQQNSNIILADIYIKSSNFMLAAQYLIKPLMCDNVSAINLINQIIENNSSIEIGKLLLNNDLFVGLLCLLKCKMETDKILDLCPRFLFESECNICLEIKQQVKFNCGHECCIDCLKNQKNTNCSYCRKPIWGFIKNKTFGSVESKMEEVD